MDKLEELLTVVAGEPEDFHKRCHQYRAMAVEVIKAMVPEGGDRLRDRGEVVSGVAFAMVQLSLEWKPDGVPWDEMLERSKAMLEIYFIQEAAKRGEGFDMGPKGAVN